MDDRNVNIDLEELFRKKLENSELYPGTAVRKSLMRRLGIKEFVRFNPSRFNIYYLGGIAAIGITAAVLITSGPGDHPAIENNPPQEHIISPDSGIGSGNSVNIQKADQQVTGEADNSLQNNPEKSIVSQQPAKADKRSGRAEDLNRKEPALKSKDDSLQKTTIGKGILPTENLNNAKILKKPIADYIASSPTGCLPLKVKFTNRSTSFDSCVWTFGDGGYSKEKNPVWIFDVTGEYKITLRVFGEEGTESVYTGQVIVYPKPVARFETLPERPILPDDEIRFVNYSMDAVKYRWEFGDGKMSEDFEPVHKYNLFKNYNVRLVVWSSNGCSDSLTVMNAFSESGCYINFPNAFIPNADGPTGGHYSYKSDESAQIFHPSTSGVSDYQLRIFSKIGILIFETSDINIGWDGYHKGQLCEPGVYVWKVRGTYKNGEPFVKMGDVTLLKK